MSIGIDIKGLLATTRQEVIENGGEQALSIAYALGFNAGFHGLKKDPPTDHKPTVLFGAEYLEGYYRGKKDPWRTRGGPK